MTLGDNWGASDAERAAPLPCDDLLPGAQVRCHRAVTIDAPAAAVFRWLCQLRESPYSYDLLDNWGRRSSHELTAGLDRLETGQAFMGLFRLASFVRDEHVTLLSKRCAVTYAVRPGPDGTRLVVRVRFVAPAGRLGSLLIGRPLAIGDLVMMRKQLLTLKALAEAQPARTLTRA